MSNDSSSPESSPAETPNSDDQHDFSHVSDETRERMEQIRSLEQQRLRRVLAQSRTHVQGPGSAPDAGEQRPPRGPSARAATERVQGQGQSNQGNRNRSRVISISHTHSSRNNLSSVAHKSDETETENKTEGTPSVGVTSENEATPPEMTDSSPAVAKDDVTPPEIPAAEVASTDRGSLKASNRSFIEKLRNLSDNAHSDELKTRYQRILDMEERRLAEGTGGRPDRSRLGRSSSFNERTRGNRYLRTQSVDPVTSSRMEDVNLPAVDSSVFDRVMSRREEGLKRLEELRKRREQGLTSSSLDVTDSSSILGSSTSLQRQQSPLVTRRSLDFSSSTFPRRYSGDMSFHYSSINELREAREPLFRPNLLTTSHLSSSMENVRRTAMETHREQISPDGPASSQPARLERETSVQQETSDTARVPQYIQGKIQGLTYVDAKGSVQYLQPSSPQYRSMIGQRGGSEGQSVRGKELQGQMDKDRELAQKKKRSLLHKEGIVDHVLMECFDSENSFEERIASIREKLYGSRVLIPSDKQEKMEDRGTPDGASAGKEVKADAEAEDKSKA